MSEAAQQRTTGAQRPAGRGRQTATDMVRSLVVVLAVVLAVVLLVPRPGEPVRDPVDVEAAAAAARASQAPVVVPALPGGWTATSARFTADGPDGAPTWHVGYLTPSERYAGVELARGATSRWLDDVTSGGLDAGAAGVSGSTWQRRTSPDGTRSSLVLTSGDVTTVVTGTAPLDELVTLAEAAVAALAEAAVASRRS